MSDMSNMSNMSDIRAQTEGTAQGGTGTSDRPRASDERMRLDGNAAAGLLAEIFAVEMTSAQSTCASCGQSVPLGALLLYGGQMGIVLRCPTCNHVQLRVVRVPERGGEYWMEMRGMARLRIAPSIPR